MYERKSFIDEVGEYDKVNKIYHRYVCKVSFLNIKQQVEARNQN